MLLKKTVALFVSCFLFAGFAACDSGGTSISSLCSKSCSQYETCYPEDFNDEYASMAECRSECEDESAQVQQQISSECWSAQKNLFKCTSNLSCSDVEAYWEEETADYPCAKYDDAVEDACADDWN